MVESKENEHRTTIEVDEDVFRQVYDSPSSLPGKEKWVTIDEDVRMIEKLLGMDVKTIGAPLWVSGDTRNCPKCGRETNWLDIVSSGLEKQHSTKMLAMVILGDKKYVNIETPRAIDDLHCYKCGREILDLRSFKCHNWAYAIGDMLRVIKQIESDKK
jgi:hypothetical protein